MYGSKTLFQKLDESIQQYQRRYKYRCIILGCFSLKLNSGGGLGGGGSKKGPNFQGEALRQMLSQHMVC